MLERKHQSVQKRVAELKGFLNKVKIYRDEPEAIEELVCEESPKFREILDPTLRAEVSRSPEIDALLPGRKKQGKTVVVTPAAHESGLFLLPYTDEFRADFIARLRERLRSLNSLMKLLRQVEQRFHEIEKLPEPETKEGAEVSKKENPFTEDYNFFKLLMALTPDNNRLGALLSEIGEITSANAVPPGRVVAALASREDKISALLAESLTQYGRMKILCDNIYLCSIASWATLSNYVSMVVKAIEREKPAAADSSIYRPEFRAFQSLLASLTSGLTGAPTLMQTKALFYAYLALNEFISDERHPKDPFRLNNFSQVGAGKTYTTPIFLRLFASVLGKKAYPNAKLITLYFTEANLCQNVLDSMVDIGVPKESVHIGHLKTLPSLSLKEGDCIIISRHEFGLKEREQIIYPLEILIRRGFSFAIVADESSFLKNSESGISMAMEYLYIHLKKRHALRVDYRLSATPVNNDSGDFIYLLSTNTINIASFLHRYPEISAQMRRVLRKIMEETPGTSEFTLDLLLTLLKKSGSLTGVLIFHEIVEEKKEDNLSQKEQSQRCRAVYYTDCPGAVLALYYYAVYSLGMFPIKLDLEQEDGNRRKITFLDILQHLGVGYQRITQPATDPIEMITGLENPIAHPGSRLLACLIPCLLLVKETTSALTYDRALNADEEIQFQINAKQLRPNLIESITHLEILEKIRQFLNLIMFANSVRKIRASQIGWRLLRSDIEREFLRLRLEFAVTYAAARGLTVVHKEEVVNRKVHQGFNITDKTERYPYLAIEPKDRVALIETLTADSGEGVLGAKIIDDLAQYFSPVRFFELSDLLEYPTKEMTHRERDQHREEIEKKRSGILETLIGGLGISGRLEKCVDLTRVLKEDLRNHRSEEDGLLHFRPSILFRYPGFLEEIHQTLSSAMNSRSEYESRELNYLMSDLGSERIDLAQRLSEYSVIFKMSESLNLPMVLRFAGSILFRLSALFGQNKINVRIDPQDTERIRRVIAHAASVENFARSLSGLTRRHEVPLLIGCHYRASQQSLIGATGAEHAINGEIAKEERYKILDAFDRLGERMGRTLVATTKSILKGFNIFNAQYGFMTEGMNNAEVRVQMAGRLRPLFSQHLEKIDQWIRILEENSQESPVLMHLRRLQEQVKIFDVIAPEMLGGFPDIQAGKGLMLNTFLFQQAHQKSFNEVFDDEAVLHYIDSRPTFNAKTVEQYCSKAIEESLVWYVGKVRGQEEISLVDVISLIEEEINLRAAENVRISSYYRILEGSRPAV
ncbi:MAG: hypothetical protein MPW17_22235 (plasmid) [Candidatus Manganitrophus sp.]|nr:hypothetical protein [Candidatus Manganitrophus sp.]MDC4228385.1 hypothetical protein [Candidatus Manganitrophus sp.]WDT73661.1 MAG: hypothetical protein MPW17_22235 [Candidatus Manganitrophus sp.]